MALIQFCYWEWCKVLQLVCLYVYMLAYLKNHI